MPFGDINYMIKRLSIMDNFVASDWDNFLRSSKFPYVTYYVTTFGNSHDYEQKHSRFRNHTTNN